MYAYVRITFSTLFFVRVLLPYAVLRFVSFTHTHSISIYPLLCSCLFYSLLFRYLHTICVFSLSNAHIPSPFAWSTTVNNNDVRATLVSHASELAIHFLFSGFLLIFFFLFCHCLVCLLHSYCYCCIDVTCTAVWDGREKKLSQSVYCAIAYNS